MYNIMFCNLKGFGVKLKYRSSIHANFFLSHAMPTFRVVQ